MKPFLGDDFLLTTDTAKRLYHEVAETLPIIDYHCHISAQEIAEDKHFSDISEVWLGGDHYKWRLMRACGIAEEKITGLTDYPQAKPALQPQAKPALQPQAKPALRERFKAFASIMPQLIGNPMYHWSHLELRRVFGIEEPLNAQNADAIYDRCNKVLETCSARQLMERFRVKAICTTDDPIDDLRWHEQIAADESFHIQVRPAFRPDKAIAVNKPGFADYVQKLEVATGRSILCADDVAAALLDRIAFFAAHGCLCADHGLDAAVFAEPDTALADAAFTMGLAGERPSQEQTEAYQTRILRALAAEYTRRGWVMQLHFGCLRNVNTRRFAELGPDTGFDAMNTQSGAEKLAALLNVFEENDGLPKTILYSLNPSDNPAIVSIMGCFQGAQPGKLQHGSAWWFNDNLDGMEAQMRSLAANGVFGLFVGMLTDSRSFLSYTRHEYFRRLLCELVGGWAESGQYPADEALLRELVANICYNNTNAYFGFGL